MITEIDSSTKSYEEKDKALCLYSAISPNANPRFSEEWFQEKSETRISNYVPAYYGFPTLDETEHSIFVLPDIETLSPIEYFVSNSVLNIGQYQYSAASLCTASVISIPERSTTSQNENFYMNHFELIGGTSTHIAKNTFENEVDSLLKRCMKLYDFTNKQEIENYLMRNFSIVEILISGFDKIRNIINDDLIKATIEHDRDIEEDFEGIFITVYANSSFEKLLEYLNKLEEEWLFNYNSEITKNLFINVMPL